MRRAADMMRGDRGYTVDGQTATTTETIMKRPELMVALPGGPGTQGTVRAAEREGVSVARLQMVYKPGVPRVINAHHHKGGLPDWAVYIGRAMPRMGYRDASPLANPYRKAEYGEGGDGALPPAPVVTHPGARHGRHGGARCHHAGHPPRVLVQASGRLGSMPW
jgi:hypothetical protein